MLTYWVCDLQHRSCRRGFISTHDILHHHIPITLFRSQDRSSDNRRILVVRKVLMIFHGRLSAIPPLTTAPERKSEQNSNINLCRGHIMTTKKRNPSTYSPAFSLSLLKLNPSIVSPNPKNRTPTSNIFLPAQHTQPSETQYPHRELNLIQNNEHINHPPFPNFRKYEKGLSGS